MRYHSDKRRTGYYDIFPNGDGDINLVHLEPFVPIAWHRHQKQTDQIFVINGVLRVKVFSRGERILTARPGDQEVYLIPSGAWHGYEALCDDTLILQFNGPSKWDGSDEERHPIDDEMPWT